jgi:hypothetical protein
MIVVDNEALNGFLKMTSSKRFFSIDDTIAQG